MKRNLLSRVVSVFMLMGMVFSSVPAPAYAVLYSPGETLNPGCLPTDANCGVTPSLSVATTTINGASGPSFTFNASSTGTDFTISTSTGALSFNLPSATPTVRGLLTAADWAIFNNKVSSQWTASSSNIYYNTGSVGIGTANPSSALDVAGIAKAVSFNASSSTAPYQINGTTVLNIGNGTTFVGESAGVNNQTAALNATFVGYGAGRSNTTGFLNTAVGGGALFTNTTGSSNTAMGATSLSSNTTGESNSVFGAQALYMNTVGSYNTAIGSNVLILGIGSSNTAIGSGALLRATTGSNNTAGGVNTGVNLTAGSNNIFYGYQAGDNITTGNNNLILGYNIDAPSATGSNQLNIGNLIFGTGLNATGTAISTGNVGIGATNPSSKLQVAGTIESTGLLFNEGANAVLGFNYPDTAYDRRLRITAGKTDTADNSQGASIDLHGNAAGGALDLVAGGATGALTFWTNNTQRAVIDASGNVGIGTATPAAGLEITPANSAGTQWTLRSGANFGNKAVVYGNGLFVSVVDTNAVFTSPDGFTWTQQSVPAPSIWRGVTYGNGLFVAVGSVGGTGTVMTSPDGVTWTNRTPAANNDWESITYANALFVAVASSGTGNRVMTSSDGITWTSQTSVSDDMWRGVTYGNGLFVAVSFLGSTYRVMTSSDGITWIGRTAPNGAFNDVAYGGGLFVAVSEGGATGVATSPDGVNWMSRTPAVSGLYWRGVTYGNGLFVAVASSGTGNRVMTSSDGITWISRTSAADNNWNGIAFGNDLFVAVADSGTTRVMTSSGALPTAVAANGSITVSGNVKPISNAAYDLGSATNRWRDLYLSGSTLHIGGQALSNSGGSLVWSGASIEATPNATNSTEIKLSEISTNGTNYTGFKAPDSLAANVLYALPSADGASGQILSTNGGSALSWATPLTTADIPDASATARGLVSTSTQTFAGNKTFSGNLILSPTPFVNLDVVQNGAVKIGDGFISSGGDFVNLSSNNWHNGTAWSSNYEDRQGAVLQLTAGDVIFFSSAAGTGVPTFTTRMIVKGSGPLAGNVGIGDDSPQAMLTVGNGDLFQVNSSGNIANIGGAAHSISNSSGALVVDSATTGAINIGTSANAKTITIGNTTSGTTLAINAGNATTGNINFDSNTLYVDTVNNRVGVGTVAPAAKLDVAGSARFQQTSGADGAADTLASGRGLNNVAGGLAFDQDVYGLAGVASVGGAASGGSANTSDIIGVYGKASVAGGTGANTRIFGVYGEGSGTGSFGGYFQGNVYASGNVGIGTGMTNPNNLLQVAGLVNFNNSRWTTQLGYQAANSNAGNYGTFTGYQAGYSNNTGGNNTAYGYQSLYSNALGSANTAIGFSALYSNVGAVSGSQENTAVGASALRYVTTGGGNTALGHSAGRTLTTGNSNTFIGYFAGYDALQKVDAVNSMALGNGAYTTADNQIVVGNNSVTQTLLKGNVGIGTTTPATKLAVAGGDVSVMPTPPSFSATGGTITTSGGYTIHTFTSSETFAVTGSGTVDVLVVAGGGGGGGGTTNAGGAGAGAGGVVYSASQAVSSGSITVNVGAGGAGGAANTNGSNGGNSSFGTIAATGGGGGGANLNSGSNGGSGGGGGFGKVGGTGTAGQGNNGGNGASSTFGAGGGAGGAGGNAGSNGGNGGPGISNSISGIATLYGGGGAGGVYDFPPSCTNIYNGTGGSGGGGNVCVAGTNGLGGGAGGAGIASGAGPNGGSGIVIVRYLTPTNIGGNVGIGTATPSQLLEVVRSTDGVVARFTDANGSCDIDPTSSALICSSDERLKKNIVTIDSMLEKMLALNPVTFNWNKESDGEEKHLGFIAQDVEKLFPSLVSTNENGFKAVAYGNFTPLIIKSIQEQQLEIAGLTGTSSLVFASTTDEILTTIDTNPINNVVRYITDKIGVGIQIVHELVAERVVAISGYFKRILANELCLTDSTGALVCVTGDQLKNISSSIAASESTESEGSADVGVETAAPVEQEIIIEEPAVEPEVEPEQVTETWPSPEATAGEAELVGQASQESASASGE